MTCPAGAPGVPSHRGYSVVVMAKAPVPGKVKTRLCPPLAPTQAAQLAEAALIDTLAAVGASATSQAVLAIEGPAPCWVGPGVSVIAQRQGGFGARLDRAVADAWQLSAQPMLVIGMDTPQVTGALLDQVAAPLTGLTDEADAVIGGAEDGGYWVIGVRCPVPGLFAGVPMSSGETGAVQRRRMTELGLRFEEVPTLRDVDEFADAVVVARLAPSSRFASSLAAMVDRDPAVGVVT